jgi:hypothetical protein
MSTRRCHVRLRSPRADDAARDGAKPIDAVDLTSEGAPARVCLAVAADNDQAEKTRKQI